MKINTENAGTSLITFRETHGRTLDQVSKNTGVAVSTLIAIEKGKSKPHPSTIYKLNTYLTEYQ